MKLVACVVAQAVGEPVKFRLKDADTGIVYPNLLTNEQTCSPSVQEAACTYIGMKMAERGVIQSPPLEYCGIINNLGLPRSVSAYVFPGKQGKRALIDEVNQLKRELAGLQERNDRQARIIRAVQGAVRGGVQ